MTTHNLNNSILLPLPIEIQSSLSDLADTIVKSTSVAGKNIKTFDTGKSRLRDMKPRDPMWLKNGGGDLLPDLFRPRIRVLLRVAT
jgi:hypothetical protein